MGTIHPFARLQPFDPITCDAMGLAFEGAWQELLMSSTRLASSANADATREAQSTRTEKRKSNSCSFHVSVFPVVPA